MSLTMMIVELVQVSADGRLVVNLALSVDFVEPDIVPDKCLAVVWDATDALASSFP
jgi:hypothetical protein